MTPVPQTIALLAVLVSGCAVRTPDSLPDTPMDDLAPWAVSARAHGSIVVSTEEGLRDHAPQYISARILHTRQGPQLVVHDLSGQQPRVAETRVRFDTPRMTDGIFVVSHFNRGFVNRLGGCFNAFSKAPSRGLFSLDEAPDGVRSIDFRFHGEHPGFSGFWVQVFDCRAPISQRVFVDISAINYLTFQVRGAAGDEELILKLADREWDWKEDAVPLGPIKWWLPAERVTTEWQRAWVPLDYLPTEINAKQLANIVFSVVAPQTGHVWVRDLAFAQSKTSDIPSATQGPRNSRKLRRGLWLWQTRAMLTDTDARDRMLGLCRRWGITDVFVQLPYTGEGTGNTWLMSWQPHALRPLLSAIAKAGIRAWALDGAPELVLPAKRQRMLTIASEVVAYNRLAPSAERFFGVRFDNEIHLAPGDPDVSRTALIDGYVDTLTKVSQLAHEHGLALGLDIPFWYDARRSASPAVDESASQPLAMRLIDVADSVGVMDYRTQVYGPDGLIANVIDELEYAGKQKKEIFVGLETLPLTDETRAEFGASGDSDGARLAIEPFSTGRLRLHWFSPKGWQRACPLLPRGITVLEQLSWEHLPATRLTFHYRGRDQIDTAMRLTALELMSLKAFVGFAIHSYDGLQKWEEH